MVRLEAINIAWLRELVTDAWHAGSSRVEGRISAQCGDGDR
jgi:hypothetical protein